MTQPATFKRVPTGPTYSVVGDVYRFLATGAETNGEYAQFEAIVSPGGGPPPHIHHREEEGFYILEGEITFQVGTRTIKAGPGDFANMPIGVLHTFRNETDRPARMLVTVAPAGLEQMFFQVGQPLAEGTSQALPPSATEIETLIQLAPQYGIELQLPHQ